MNAVSLILIAGLGLAGLFLLICLLVALSLGRPWLKAFLAGTPIPILAIVGMKLRGSNADKILEQGIAANQAGCKVEWAELERAFLQNVDLEKVTLAYIASQRSQLGFTFTELVAAEQDGKLNSLMQR